MKKILLLLSALIFSSTLTLATVASAQEADGTKPHHSRKSKASGKKKHKNKKAKKGPGEAKAPKSSRGKLIPGKNHPSEPTPPPPPPVDDAPVPPPLEGP